MNKEMKQLENLGEYEVYRYRPSLFHLFGKYYPEEITMRRFIRLVLAFTDGYEIYYLVQNRTTVAYCMIQNGKSNRYDFATEDDLVVGPILVMPEFRGLGAGTQLIKKVLDLNVNKFKYAYAYIKRDNIASIRTFEKAGFAYYKNAFVTKIKADVKQTEDKNTGYLIVRIGN